MPRKKIFYAVVVLILTAIFLITYYNDTLINLVNNNVVSIILYRHQHPFILEIIFFVSYIIMTSFSLPVALIMSLLAGIIFNNIIAIVLVSFASTIGATLAFLMSRYFLRDYCSTRYANQYKNINNGISKHGASYLFATRMIPVFPFFIINILSGLTTLTAKKFFFISQVAMLPMTIIIILIGDNIGKIIINEINIGLELLILMSVFGLIPILSRLFFNKYFRQ